MSENGELINQVFLAGTIKKRGDSWVLLDCDSAEDSRAIMCGLPKDGANLGNAQPGDYVKLKGHIEAWSKKRDDGKWSNGLSVRVDEIKSVTPAARARQREMEPF
jgi:hypothetical protein